MEIKNCPFCGGDPIMWAATDCKDGFVHGTTINCQSCGISINDEYQDAAIAAWNTRAHSAEIAGALRDAERWQPIESAPRDGTYILLGYADSHSEEGRWMGDASRNHWGETGWFASDDDVLCEHPSKPTHWRPLPAPPTLNSAMQQGGGGGDHG